MEFLREINEMAKGKRTLVIKAYNQTDIDRDDPTNFPPKHTERFTGLSDDADTVQKAVVEWLVDEGEDEDESIDRVEAMEVGADGSLYEDNEMDGYEWQFTLEN